MTEPNLTAAGGPDASATRLRNVLSVAGYLVAVAALLWLLAQHHLLARGPIGIAIQAGAVLLMIWARVTFGRRSFHAAASITAGGLVTTGPYRYWRHPIYASVTYFAWAGQLDAPTAASLAAAALVTAGLFLRMVLEERFLTQAYPEYAAHSKRAKRWIPFVL